MGKLKDALATMIVAAVISAFLGGCAGGGRCNTDSCYDKLATEKDPFDDGEVVAWGVTENEGQKEKEQARQLASEKRK